MKKIIIILCLFQSIIVNSQTIDWSNFSEQTMNDVMFNKMNDCIHPDKVVSKYKTSQLQEKIYRCLKRNNEKVQLQVLGVKINQILGKCDSPFVKEANYVGNIGIIDSIPCLNVNTYQDIANKCFDDWVSSENILFMKWSQIGEAITYYSIKTKTIYISFVYLN